MGEEGRTFRFSAESITPLIISGADNNSYNLEKEGLRPPSVRGALWCWFRAMMGGVVGGDVAKVRKLEATVWGTTRPQVLGDNSQAARG